MKRLVTIAIVVAAAALTGCGGEERVASDEFRGRLASIGERGGELWGQLEQRAQSLETDQPLPADIEQALEALIEFQEQTVAELETMTPPEAAEDPVGMLINALRNRTESFKAAIAVGHFTEQDFDRVTQAGEEIDEAFEQLRAEGFLPTTDDHEE
jgi:hypothetical protein